MRPRSPRPALLRWPHFTSRSRHCNERASDTPVASPARRRRADFRVRRRDRARAGRGGGLIPSRTSRSTRPRSTSGKRAAAALAAARREAWLWLIDRMATGDASLVPEPGAEALETLRPEPGVRRREDRGGTLPRHGRRALPRGRGARLAGRFRRSPRPGADSRHARAARSAHVGRRSALGAEQPVARGPGGAPPTVTRSRSSRRPATSPTSSPSAPRTR